MIRRDERMLRWYPPAWRARYGDELSALLEDTYATAGRVPWRARLGLLRAGLEERAREAGLVGPAGGPAGRVSGGSVLVLCAWAFFLVAGAMFAKFTDQWRSATPAGARALPTAALAVAAAAAIVAAALVVLAALLVVPAFVRLVRAGRWPEVRRPVVRAGAAFMVAAVAFAGAIGWAHHLSAHDRNGGLPVYGVALVAVSLLAVVAVGLGTAAAVAVARRVELPERLVRLLGALALGVSAAMALLFAGVVTWWAAEAAHAPSVLLNGIGVGFASGTAPPTLVAAGVLMVLGLVLAAAGSVRVAGALRNPPAT